MKRIFVVITAAAIAAAAFISCSKPVNLTKDAFTQVQEAEPANIPLMSMLADKPYYIRWEKGSILYKDAMRRSTKWEKLMDFQPEGFDIHKKEAMGVRLIPAKYMENISFSPDGKYAAFTMKLGPSLNGSIALADIKENKVIFTETVEDRPQFPRVQNSIAIRDSFFGPVFSDDSKYMAYSRYNYLNTRNIRIRDIQSGKTEDINNAVLPLVSGGTVYFISYGKGKFIFILKKEKIGSGKIETLMPVDEGITCLIEVRGKIIMGTESSVYRIDPVTGPVKLFTFDDIKKDTDAFEVNDMRAASAADRDYIFITVKKRIKENYFWNVYGREI